MFSSLSFIRPAERYTAAISFVTLAVVMVGHAVLETARDALFLSSIPATNLPWVYLAIAAVSLVVQKFESRIPEDGLHWILSGWLLFSAAVTFAFWLLLEQLGRIGLYALYVWSGLMVSLVLVHFWTLLSALVTMTSAKRLFSFIGAGSGFGAILGSGVAVVATEYVPARDLLLFSVGTLILAAVGPYMLARRAPTTEPSESSDEDAMSGIADTIRTIAGNPYAWRLAALVFIGTITVTFVDILFKATAADAIEPERLARFFAVVYLILNVLSLGIQLVVVQPIIRRLSVSGALTVLPSVLVVGAVSMLSGSSVLGALLMKSADGALRHSLHRTALELLYVPLSSKIRMKVKTFIDVAGQRGGQAVASLVLLAGLAVSQDGHVYMTAVLVLALTWIWLARSLNKHYLNLFRSVLKSDTIEIGLDYPDLDVGSLESMLEALNSEDDARVIAAMKLLEEERKANVIPALILYHPSGQVVVEALETFVRNGRTDFIPVAKRIESDAAPAVQAAILAALTSIKPDQQLLRDRLKSEDETVQAVASILAVDKGWEASEPWEGLWSRLASDGHDEQKRALIQAIRSAESDEFDEELIMMAQTQNPDTKVAIINAMRHHARPAFLPALRDMMIDRRVREEATEALLGCGLDAFDFLSKSLNDSDVPQRVRWQLPFALSRFDDERAVGILLEHLPDEQDGMVRYRIVRELEGMRLLQPKLKLDKNILFRCAESNLRQAFQLLDYRLTAQREIEERPELQIEDQELLLRLLYDKETNATDILLRLLGLLNGEEDFSGIIRGVRASNPKRRSSSLELLEHALDPRIRDSVLALLDDRPDIDRVYGSPEYHQPEVMEYEELLDIFLTGDSEMLRLIAMHLIDRLDLRPIVALGQWRA